MNSEQLRKRWYRHECQVCKMSALTTKKEKMCCGVDCATEIETRAERLKRHNDCTAYRTSPESETYWSS